MKTTELLLNIFFPPKCAVCRKLLPYNSDLPFCHVCLTKWTAEKSRLCPACNNPISDCTCGISGDIRNYIDGEYHLTVYNLESGIGKNLVVKCKRDYDRALFNMLGSELSELAQSRFSELSPLIVNIPRKASTIRKTGHDQTGLLCSIIAHTTGFDYEQVLLHRGGRAQKSLEWSERFENARSCYCAADSINIIRGRNIILVDDVITSGATMTACAGILKKNGARRVYALSIAKTVRK